MDTQRRSTEVLHPTFLGRDLDRMPPFRRKVRSGKKSETCSSISNRMIATMAIDAIGVLGLATLGTNGQFV